MIGPPRTISSRRAASILREVFEQDTDRLRVPAVDGTLVQLGHGAPVCTVAIREPGDVLPPRA